MLTAQTEIEKDEDKKPPGIFYPHLTHYDDKRNILTSLELHSTTGTKNDLLELSEDYLFYLRGEELEVLNLNGECFFGYEIEEQRIWIENKDNGSQEVFVAEKKFELENFIAKLKTKCPQQGFFKHFKLLDQTGKGKKSEVYIAERNSDKQIFAVKIQNNSKLEEEIEILRELQHPNLIYFREYFIETNNSYIVMDYEDGGSLLDRIYPIDTLTYGEKLKVVIDMLNALEFLRIKGIVHRDIKPENILYSKKDGNYKIGDFGLALKVGEKTTKLSGTPGYIAPEFFQKVNEEMEVDIKSDIFSMGITLYEIFTSKQFYAGSSNEEILDKNIKTTSLHRRSYNSLDTYGIEKKLLDKMIRTNKNTRKNSYQIMLSSTFNKITRLYGRLKKESHPKDKTSSSEEDNFMSAVKRTFKIKSS